MEDLVAIRARCGARRFGFITWGRLWDAIDDSELLGVVRSHIGGFDIPPVDELELCESLQQVSSGKYFFEAIWEFSRSAPSVLTDEWKKKKRDDLRQGDDIYFVGELL